MASRKIEYKHASLETVTADDVADIVTALKLGKHFLAGRMFEALCMTIRDLPEYEVFLLARRVHFDAGLPYRGEQSKPRPVRTS